MIHYQCQKRLHSTQDDYILDVNFHLLKGEILALTGPSGSGKTTLLRLLAGLEKPDLGRIESENKVWVDVQENTWLSPQQRAVGMVFQNYALFPNMTIRENFTYALPDRIEATRVDEMLSTLNLKALAHKKPHQLSGGQQQRVALGRALIPRPSILLLDEPLSALDQNFREQMHTYLLRLHKEYAFSMIIVSHDQQEIYTLADRIATLDQGKMSIVDKKPIQTWENIQETELILKGIIIKIKFKRLAPLAIILIGDNLIELPIPSTFFVGKKVKITFSSDGNPVLLSS